MATKILALDGLNDAKLCGLVEQLLCTISGVSEAHIDFLSQKLSLKIEGRDSSRTIEDVIDTLGNTMPEVTIRLTDVGEDVSEPEPFRRNGPYIDYGEPDEAEPYSYEEQEEEARSEEAAALPKAPFDISPQTSLCFISAFMAIICFLLAKLLPQEGLLSYFCSVISFLLCALGAVFLCTDSRYGEHKMSCGVYVPVCAVMLFAGDRVGAIASLLIFIGGLLALRLINLMLDATVDKTFDIHPASVRTIHDGVTDYLPPEQLFEGDLFVVEPGETVPLDGFVSEGAGEVQPFLLEEAYSPQVGDPVHCGDHILSGTLTLAVAGTQNTSPASLAETLLMDKNRLASTKDTLRARNWSVISTAALLALACLSAFFAYYSVPHRAWLPTLAALLLLACPSGLSAAAVNIQRGGLLGILRHGAVINSGKLAERFSRIKSAVFEFTGVVTEGSYTVHEIWAAEDVTREQVMEVAASIECQSSHPIAEAIVSHYESRAGKQADPGDTAMFENIVGYGVRAMYQRRVALVGSERLMREAGIEIPPNTTGKLAVYIALRGEYLGALFLEDPPRPGVSETVSRLSGRGVTKISAMTGRDFSAAAPLCRSVGISEVYAELNPSTRLGTLQNLVRKEERSAELMYVAPKEQIEPMRDICTDVALGASMQETLRGDFSAAIPSGEIAPLVHLIQCCRSMKWAESLCIFLSVGGRVALFAYALWSGLALPYAALASTLLILLTSGVVAGLYKK